MYDDFTQGSHPKHCGRQRIGQGISISTPVVELHLKGFLRTFGAGESPYTFCETAHEVMKFYARTLTETPRARLKSMKASAGAS
jgi:hypothetical protein